LKELGFAYSTKSGISIGIDDMLSRATKLSLSKTPKRKPVKVQQQYLDGAITHGERYTDHLLWGDVTEKKSRTECSKRSKATTRRHHQPVYVMADSGARGSNSRFALSGMRGLMAKPSGEVMEDPITSNFREGLTVLEYFISTHGVVRVSLTPLSRPRTRAT